jgi:hypothetical protein
VCENDISPECSTLENIEYESIKKHAGLAIKRASDLIQSGPSSSSSSYKIQLAKQTKHIVK